MVPGDAAVRAVTPAVPVPLSTFVLVPPMAVPIVLRVYDPSYVREPS